MRKWIRRPPSARGAGGFTLLETLIASTLLFLILAAAMGSYAFFVHQPAQAHRAFDHRFARLRAAWDLNSTLESIQPTVVRDGDRLGLYFLGREEGFTAVTSRPLLSSAELAVFRLFLEPEEGGQQLLVYEEAPLEVALTDAAQTLPFDSRIVLLQLPEALLFTYRVKDPQADIIDLSLINISEPT